VHGGDAGDGVGLPLAEVYEDTELAAAPAA
jgi:hypothetical protein